DLHLIEHARDGAAWAEKGRMAQLAGLYRASIVPLERAVDCGAPTKLLISLGCAFHETERYGDALAAYQRFLDGQPEPEWIAAALTNQGNSWARMGDLDRAIGAQRRAVEREPERAVFRINLAVSLRQQKAYEEAVRVLDEALARAAPGE